MSITSSNLALGTVQFGLDYGINNPQGQVAYTDVKNILSHAQSQGIIYLDTAVAYGNSETVLGQAIKELGLSFSIVSKLPANIAQGLVKATVEQSLKKLDQETIEGYLFHNFDDFKQTPALLAELKEVQALGLVNKIGFSVYYPHQVEYLFDQQISFDLIQLPYNLFDQRFEYLLPLLKQQGVEIHTRSVFLQGLFFKDLSKLSLHFQVVQEKLRQFKQLSIDHQIPLGALLLNFVRLQSSIDQIVVGVDTLQHLSDNLKSIDFLAKTRNLYPVLKELKEENEQIILPFHWK